MEEGLLLKRLVVAWLEVVKAGNGYAGRLYVFAAALAMLLVDQAVGQAFGAGGEVENAPWFL